MEAISLKLENEFLHDIKKTMKKHRYTTKTEFIREAIRDKIKDLEKEEAFKKLESHFGKFKGKKTTYKQEREVREKVGKEIAKRFGIKLD